MERRDREDPEHRRLPDEESGTARFASLAARARSEGIRVWIDALESPERSVRGVALEALAGAGRAAAPAIPALLELLKVRRVELIGPVERILAGAGDDAVAPVLELFHDDPELGAPLLAGLGPVAIPALIELARNESLGSDARVQAVRALRRIGDEAESAIPALFDLFVNEDDFALNRALGAALPSLGPAILPYVVRAHEIYRADPDRDHLAGRRVIRRAGRFLDLLAELPDARKRLPAGAVAALERALRSRDARLAEAGASFLARCRFSPPELQGALRALLDSERRPTRRAAADALSRSPMAEPGALRILLAELNELSEAPARARVTRALCRLHLEEEDLAAALRQLADPASRESPGVVFEAALGLRARGLPGPDPAALISEALSRPAGVFFDAALQELPRLGAEASRVVPELVGLAEDRGSPGTTRVPAVDALGRLGKLGLAALPSLIRLSSDDTVGRHLRDSARRAIQLIREARDRRAGPATQRRHQSPRSERFPDDRG